MNHTKYYGCYHCLQVVDCEEIMEWTDNYETPICPYCGVDSLCEEISQEKLKEMNKEMFDGF